MREARKLATDKLVKLYEIDATSLGGEVYRFCSSLDADVSIDTITSAGVDITVTTNTNHLLMEGDIIRILNAFEQEYNGDFEVTEVDSPTSFKYRTTSTPSNSVATGAYLRCIRLNGTQYFNGNQYYPIEIDVSGFEWDGQGGSLPTPKLLISNKHKILVSAVITLKNLTGAKFTRIRTFRKYLDDGSSPDSTMILPKDVYRINRKSAQNKIFMEFELASGIDQDGAKIPAEQCLRDTCLQRYRHYDGSNFDYSMATCPYVGGNFFTAAGVVTYDPANDRCGKRLSDCALRFGSAPLPIKATPGIGGV